MITYVTDDGMYWELEENSLTTVYTTDDNQYKVDHYVYYTSHYSPDQEDVIVREVYFVVEDNKRLIGSFLSCRDAVTKILSKRLCDVL